MQLLTAPRILRRAALAGGLTTVACLPRLLVWTQNVYPVWFSAVVIALTSAVMWGFVLAWEERSLGRAPFALPRSAQLWQAASLFACVAAGYRLAVLDPVLLSHRLAERPASFAQWLAAGLFQLSFLQLFLLLAPVALCSRLFRDRRAAMGIAVLLGLYVTWRALARSEADPSPALVLQVLLARALSDGFAVWFYQRGGVFVSWWIAIVVHARHLLLWLA
jgi:hypothetical protein